MKVPLKTLIAVLASHDSIIKNNELARVFEHLYKGDTEKRLGDFHFVFTGGTFRRLILGVDDPGRDRIIKDPETYPVTSENQARFIYPIDPEVRDFIMKPDNNGSPNLTVLPDHAEGGVTVLANLIVQRQCSIIWPFLSPITVHWLTNPENLALMRLCDLWNAKRLMNGQSVRTWFHDEADRDFKRNPQEIPLKICLCTRDKDNLPPLPKANLRSEDSMLWYEVELPVRKRRDDIFWTQFDKQTIALIAHDEMKSRMIDFAIQYENELDNFQRILATGTTGQEIINACKKLRENNKVRRCLSGPKGGDIEIATEILFNRCHIVVFFIDPLHPHPHIDDIRVVFSACMAEILNNDVRMLTNQVQAWEWMEAAVRHYRKVKP